MIDIGSAMLGMTVAETLRRNRKITSTTSASVSSSVNVTSCTDAWIVAERSYSTSTFTDCGMSARTFASAAFTWSDTSTVLVPGCRWIARTIAGSPLYQLAVLLFWTLSVTCPSSLKCTGAPLRYATMMFLNAAALSSCPVAWSVSACCGPQSTPDGMFTFWFVIAVVMSSSAIPRVASADGSICSRTAYFCVP